MKLHPSRLPLKLGTLALAFILPHVASAQVLQVGDFETGTTSPFSVQAYNPSTNITVVTSPVRAGGYALKSLLLNTDPKVNSGQRSEVSNGSFVGPGLGNVYWYGLSMYIPTTFTFASSYDGVIYQFHARASSGSPVLAFRIQAINNLPTLKITTDALSGTSGSNRQTLYLDSNFSTVGSWIDWVIKVKWTSNNTGEWTIWKNGVIIVQQTGVQTTYSTETLPPYAKFGQYHTVGLNSIYGGSDNSIPSNIIYFDEFRIAGSSSTYADVAPGGGAPGNNPPTISDIPNQTTPVGTAVGPISFTVGDVETAAASLTLTASSSNPSVVPSANIVLGGSGANRTVTVTPAAGQNGTSTITLTVTDGGSATASDAFVLTAGTPNTPPTISDISNKTTAAGTAIGPISFTIGDAETPTGSLTLTKSSSNPTLVPTGNIVFGGSGAGRTVTITPASGQSGTSTITITVIDGGGLTASDAFTLTVTAANTPPTISDIPNQTTVTNNAVGPISFTIGDAETSAGSLTLTKSSSNTALVPTANIVLAGSGGNRTVKVTPATGQTGTATITVTVTDGGGLTASDTFTVTVSANTPPTISSIANQSSSGGQTIGPISFTIGDAETAASALTLSFTTSNNVVLPVGKVILGGSGANRTVQCLYAGHTGTSTVTIKVKDASTPSLSATTAFTVTFQ